MYARVITAQTGPDGFDSVIGLGREQLPGASQQPGFKGFIMNQRWFSHDHRIGTAGGSK